MSFRPSDIVPISEARARLTELARRLGYHHALASEHANVVLVEDAITGLRQALAGQLVSDDELDNALGSASVS